MYNMKAIKDCLLFSSLLLCFSPVYPHLDSQIKLDLQNKIKAEIPQWIHDQISSDLKDVSSITTDMIDKTFNNYKGYIARYTIVNGKIDAKFNQAGWYSFPTTIFMTYLIKKLNTYVPLPDVDFLVVLDDGVSVKDCFVPVLGFCKKVNEKNILLVPDYQVLQLLQIQPSDFFTNGNVLSQLYNGSKLYPWAKKISKAIWRGTTTGGQYTMDNYEKFPRVKLVNLSNKFPNFLDAKFNGVHFDDGVLISKFHALDYIGFSMSIEDHLRYKYQILVDGNTASWPGAYWRFNSNSVVLKQSSDYIQWYYSLFQPYVHYIPLTNNVDDVIEKIQWAIDNDEQAQEIVKRANAVCAECLTYVDMLYYFYEVICAYSTLQNSVKQTQF